MATTYSTLAAREEVPSLRLGKDNLKVAALLVHPPPLAEPAFGTDITPMIAGLLPNGV